MSSSVNKAYLVSSLASISVTTAPLKTTRVNSEEREHVKCETETCVSAVYCLIIDYNHHLTPLLYLPLAPGDREDQAGPKEGRQNQNQQHNYDLYSQMLQMKYTKSEYSEEEDQMN